MLLDSVPQLDEYINLLCIAGKMIVCWVVQGLIPGKDMVFSLLQNLQIGSGAHPASYSMATGGN
jgi:hypothetical protein